MRAIWIFFFILAAQAITASESEERANAFAIANGAYNAATTQRQFRNAATGFESLLSPDYRNDALYYNIGNARMKAGDYGRAIVAYRKAKLFRPRDVWLDANLTQALSGAPGRIAEAPEPWWRSVFFWSGWLSYPEKFNAGLALWGAAVLAFAAGTVWPKLAQIARLRFVGSVLVCVAVLFSIDAYVAYNDLYFSNRAVVIAHTDAKRSPSVNGDGAFDKPLEDGAEFTVIERRDEWVFGHFHGIGDAWLPAKNVAE